MHLIFALYPVFLSAIFVFNFNPHYYFDWLYDAQTKEMITDLNSDFIRSPVKKSKINLGITWLFEPTINYYRATKNLDWLNPVNRDGYQGEFDYYYLYNDTDFIKNNNLTIVKEYHISESELAKK